MGHAPALAAAPADAAAGGGNGRAAAAAAAVAPAASAAGAAAVSASEPPTKRQRSEPEAGSDGRAWMGGDRARPGLERPLPRLQTKPYDDLRGHTGFLLFCTKHVGDGAAEA